MKLLLPGDLLASLLLWLALTCLPALSLSRPSQHFEVQPEAQYLVHNGHDARLRCLVREREGECLWLRDGRAIGPIAKKYQFVRSPDDGDCSLTIRNVSVQQDDGSWQCQVTASDVDRESLQSRPVHLLVLVAPERALIKNVTQESRLVLIENVGGLVTCEIRGGNPAPQIEWYLDGKNMSKEAQTSSFTNGASSAARVTQSRLRLSDIKRSMNGKNLTCVGVHQTKNQSTSVELDVQYEPTVSVVQREYSIVEGSPLSITCQVDSNPAPTQVSWRLVSDSLSRAKQPAERQRVSSPVRPGPQLEFERISREQNQNVFECYAQNERGLSPPVDVKLNVLYAPIMLNTSGAESVLVGSQAQLECLFDGNPEPEVKWLYTDPLGRQASSVQLDNKRQQLLTINNVTYRNEGDYHCEARNQINGVNYGVRSSNIILDVYGEPQFLSKSPVLAKAVQGTRADLSLTFCSDPPPNKVFWQFGSLRMDVRLTNGQQKASVPLPGGGQHSRNPLSQRFQVHPLVALQKRDSQFSKVTTCFEAQLSIPEAELTDQRDYTLVVENERGQQAASVKLRMSSPLSPMLMISSAFVTICGLFLCSLVAMFLLKKRPSQSGAGSDGLHNSSSGVGASNGHLLSAKKNVEHLANGAAAQAAALAQAAVAANAQLMQQQTRNGVVSGTGNGLANNASNPGSMPACNSLTSLADDTKAAAQAIMMSMSGAGNCSDSSSANDQRQLLVSTSTSSSPSALGHSGASSVASSSRHQTTRRQLAASTASSSLATERESPDGASRAGSRSPAARMAHISLEDEHDQHEHDTDSHLQEQLEVQTPGQQQADERALIYANLAFQQDNEPRSSLRHLKRQQALPSSQTSEEDPADQDSLSLSATDAGGSLRSSVGATIALMNSLAAQQQQHQPNAHSGALNGAINQQLANSRQLIRKPGPPKPPKPSIQQRNRFYQQQQAGGGLVMIGHQLDVQEMAGQGHYQASPEGTSELAAEYSRIAFPARAEL